MAQLEHEQLTTKYDPKSVEDRIYTMWLEGRYFHSEPDSKRKPYTIVIPPPNVTSFLHCGHALNNVIQDILIRFKRMQGCNALWLPGTDHAGIATQNVVERELAAEGKTRHDLGREEFVKRVWEWKEQYGSRIISQLKKLGCSCDWERERFTMDEGLSRAVREAFVRLYEKGLIYRGEYMINWCPRCQTALSDDEVEHEEHESYLWYIRYPFKDEPRLHITVATTRPETMLGDTAVAVHPDDERYSGFIGKTLILPFMQREIPIIGDNRVDPQFGTGAVKITPAHDPNDFVIGRERGLPLVQVINEDGTMSKEAGNYAGMDRYECREALVEDLKEENLLQKTQPHVHAAGHCYRCHTVIEPYVSVQWFVKTKPLAEKALAVQDQGLVRFIPARWEKVYRAWLENVRDWCISRQLWWGHRIPAWYCECGEITVAREDPAACAQCGSNNIRRDEDVLDTWFSSALWPFSTLGWPDDTAELEYYYPTDVLVTDRGIIYLWVARMVMDGLLFMGEVPFHDVFINATVMDEQGRRMSKSLGNGIDPVDMIEKYGTDAVRFSLMMLTVEQQDARLSEKKFELGRNFANKVWNASRFVLMNLEGPLEPVPMDVSSKLALEDRWILSRLGGAVNRCTDALSNYRLNEAAATIYDFTWREFCDWYVEIVKPRLLKKDEDGTLARAVLIHCLDTVMRLLHPFAPFISEAIWQKIRPMLPYSLTKWESGETGPPDSLIIAAWPDGTRHAVDLEAERAMGLLQGVIRSIRDVRSKMNIPDSRPLELVASAGSEDIGDILRTHAAMLGALAGVEKLTAGVDLARPPSAASDVVEGVQLFVPLEGVIDLDQERGRLRRRIEEAEKLLAGSDAKLKNENFVARAPAEVVAAERERNAQQRERLEKLRASWKELGGSA